MKAGPSGQFRPLLLARRHLGLVSNETQKIHYLNCHIQSQFVQHLVVGRGHGRRAQPWRVREPPNVHW